MKRFLSKPLVAWSGLGLCLLVALGAVGYQRLEHQPIDVPAVTFGIAGIIAAIFALLVTESTLENIDLGLKRQTDRLSDEITNLEDATRRNLSGFAEIFARALWLLKQAEEEVWYINFLFAFGEPHKINVRMAGEYERIARMLGITTNYQQAVKEFYLTLLDKVRTIPTFHALTLTEDSLRTLCLERLAKRQEYLQLQPAEIITAEQRSHRDVEGAKAQRDTYIESQGDCTIQSIDRLPLQLLIARIRSRTGDERKWGCLVFLVGTENIGNHKPRGFYTELDHVVDVYKELALGFMPTDSSGLVPVLDGSDPLATNPPAANQTAPTSASN